MTASAALASSTPVRPTGEPAWTREAFEGLSTLEAEAVLLRRLRRLVAGGLEPLAALRLAAQLDRPLP
jgi:hypothetical protein